MKILITEEQNELIKKKLKSLTNEVGWKMASKAVGGIKNYLYIMYDGKPINLFLNVLDNLKLNKNGYDLTLYQGWWQLIKKSSWGLPLAVFDSSLRIIFDNNDIPEELYIKYRSELIRELVRMYPELGEGETEVVVYEDSGMYQKHDRFKL